MEEDSLCSALVKICRSFGGRSVVRRLVSQKLSDLFEIVVFDTGLFFKTTTCTIILRHEFDEESTFELLIVEDGAIFEAMNFVRTEEACLGGVGVIIISHAVDGIFQVVMCNEAIDNGVHIRFVGVGSCCVSMKFMYLFEARFEGVVPVWGPVIRFSLPRFVMFERG